MMQYSITNAKYVCIDHISTRIPCLRLNIQYQGIISIYIEKIRGINSMYQHC